jgi:hypothetical protein
MSLDSQDDAHLLSAQWLVERSRKRAIAITNQPGHRQTICAGLVDEPVGLLRNPLGIRSRLASRLDVVRSTKRSFASGPARSFRACGPTFRPTGASARMAEVTEIFENRLRPLKCQEADWF